MRASRRRPQRMLFLTLFLGFLVVAGGLVGPVAAQTGSYPKLDYSLAFAPYNEGDYATAGEAFRSAGRGGIRSTEGRWIDSICYHTMIGECHYRMGENTTALEHFNTALQLFMQHRNWMIRVEFPPVVGPHQRGPRPAITWGASTRASRPAQIPQKMLILQGGVAAVGNTIVAAPNQNFSIKVTEIVRCIAWALYRRAEIMGPACAHDPLTGQLVDAISRRPGPPNHWSQAWIDCWLGIAYASAGKPVQAASELQKSLVIGGQFDHHLTGIALLSLGKIAFMQGQHNAASNYFYEATFPAAVYEQYDVIEEALLGAALTHMVSGQKGAYPPLAPAAAWARRNSRGLEVALETAAAENLANAGDSVGAGKILEHARRTMGRSEMAVGRAGARVNFQTALVNFQRGLLAPGARAFDACMAFQRKSSLKLYQITLVDRLYTSRLVSDRVAGLLFTQVLREPAASDWAVNPMETLSVVLTPHPLPFEHWFEVAMQRKEHEKAIEIADLIRRHRFYSTLPMGGRLLSLRWILEGPEESLSEAARLQKRDLLLRYPAFAQLSRQSAAITEALRALPVVSADEEQQKAIGGHLATLADISARQELILRAIALRRDPSEFSFPRKLNFKEMRKRIPEGRLVLSFFSTARYVYGFLFSKDKYAHWQVEAPAKVRAEVKNLLRQMGHHDKNQAVNMKAFASDEWRATSQSVLRLLTNSTDANVWEQFDELVIVPDGVLWYVPFEALQVDVGGGATAPLISRVRVRYAPLVSLVEPDARTMAPRPRTAVVAGQLVPREADESVAETLDAIRSVTGVAMPLPQRLGIPSSLLASQIDRLIVLSDVEDAERAPYAWSPMQVDRGKPGSMLSNWFSLPWGGPQQVVMPGFHTPAEQSLKKGGTGMEVFLSVCGMMSTGSRTILLSRWRVGGQSSRDLIREYVQELPHATASTAWRRSVQLSMSRELDPDDEPRVNRNDNVGPLRAAHPFFWSGYLLVDTGAVPGGRPDEPPAAPALEVKAPPAAAGAAGAGAAGAPAPKGAPAGPPAAAIPGARKKPE